MNTALVTDPPKNALALALVELERDEPTAAITLRAAFEEMFDDADRWTKQAAAISVTSEDDTRGMKLARETRLALREIRIKSDKARKRLKETILREGRAIDGIHNVLKALVEPLEEKLLLDETFGERAEEERIKTLGASRAQALTAYGIDPTSYVNLGAMVSETWELTIETAKRADADRKAEAKKQEEIKLEAERLSAVRAEEERQAQIKAEAERVEREKAQLAENERLKKENERKAAEAKAMLEAHTAERKAAELAAEKERVAAAERQRQVEIVKTKLTAAAAVERENRVKAEIELAAQKKAEADRVAKEEAERLAERQRHAAEREAAELAPDKEKLMLLAQAINAFPMPTFTTAKGKAAADKVRTNFGKLADWITKTAGEL